MKYNGNSSGYSDKNGYDNHNSYGGDSKNGYGGGHRNGFGGGRGGGKSGSGGERVDRGSKWDFQKGKLNKVDFSKANLKPLQKNFYHEHASVSRRGQGEVDQWLAENNVTLDGQDIPRPVFEFVEGSFPEPIENLLHSHYQKPTVIQSISWPVALSGRDLIAIAQTGSGKTLGFIIPAIVHTLNQPKRAYGEGPSVVVLLPTRELAQQVEEVARDYCKAMKLNLVCCFGGASKGPQAGGLRRGVDVIIATPGRLNDFMETNTTNMGRCSYLVLDEADRMLDMGFEPQIRQIVGQIRPDRQTLMFSATWPKEVRNLASDFQTDAVFLNVGSMDLSANHNIKQNVEVLEEHQKPQRLFELLGTIMNEKECKTIIFTETKKKADELTRSMRRDGWPALCIHGDKQQSERDWVLNQFREGKTPILLATDVAARGLDVKDIRFVVNYDYPNNSEDYVHRIGRTGRSDNKGTAYTFFTRQNAPKARDLIKVMEEANQEIPDDLSNLCRGNNFPKAFGNPRKRGYDGGNHGRYGDAKRGRFENGGSKGYGGGRGGFRGGNRGGGGGNKNSWGNAASNGRW